MSRLLSRPHAAWNLKAAMGSTVNSEKRAATSMEEMVYFPVGAQHKKKGQEAKKARRSGRDKGDQPTWRSAWLQYCTETSLHGLKQVAEQQPFVLRR